MALVGVPFRAQGRDPASGLDCLGVVICAFQITPAPTPRYRLTDGTWERIEREIGPWFDQDKRGCHPGNLAVFRLPRSFHFGVVGERHLVHADLTLGRVVARRLPAELGLEVRYFSLREGRY